MTRKRIRVRMKITTEGVPVVVEWHKFVVGSSFYIPCLDRRALASKIDAAAKERNMRVKYRFTMENGTQGVRFWRIR